jgi:hypothetical protein
MAEYTQSRQIINKEKQTNMKHKNHIVDDVIIIELRTHKGKQMKPFILTRQECCTCGEIIDNSDKVYTTPNKDGTHG